MRRACLSERSICPSASAPGFPLGETRKQSGFAAQETNDGDLCAGYGGKDPLPVEIQMQHDTRHDQTCVPQRLIG